MKTANCFTKTALFVLVILLVAMLLPQQASALPANYSVSGFTDGNYTGALFSGTYFGKSNIPASVYVYGEDKASSTFVQFASQVDNYISYVDSCANTQCGQESPANPSDLWRINNASSGQSVQVSVDTYQMLVLAKQMYHETDGAYNPASYRLVDLWGFSSRTYGYNGNLPYDRQWQSYKTQPPVVYDAYYLPLPEQKYVDAFVKLADFDSVVLTEDGGNYYVTKNCPDVVVDGVAYSQWLDLGGIAKGYVVDGLIDLLNNYGYQHYYVNVGSSSMAFTTRNDGTPFTFGFQNPSNIWQSYLSVSLSNSVMSTSGQYIRKYTTPTGERYSHIIDCKTGRPTQSAVETVSVVKSMQQGYFSGEADCWTTALTVLGEDNLKAFLTNTNYTNAFEVSSVVGTNNVYTNIEQSKIATFDKSFSMATKVQVVDGNKQVTFKAVKSTVVLVVLSVCAGALVVFGLVKLVVARAIPAAKRIALVKSDKFFKLADVAVYVAVVVVIVSLFGTFVFGRNTELPTSISIQTFAGERLFVYKAQTDDYTVNSTNQYDVQVVEQAGKLVVTVTNKDNDNYNVVEITNDNGKVVAKVVDANCGLHKECVNYFPAITTKKGTIICNPHGLKVVADGVGNDYILI